MLPNLVVLTVCLRNAYLPPEFRQTGGERCWVFTQSRCFTCETPGHRFQDAHSSKATKAQLVHMMKCPSTKKCSGDRLEYYKFQLTGY